MRLHIDKLGKVAITVEENYWDIKKDYDKLTVVEIEGKFATYISRKPVPAGIELSNRTYWIPFSSLKEEIVIAYNTFVDKYGSIIDGHDTSIEDILNILKTHNASIDKFNTKLSDTLVKVNESVKQIVENSTNTINKANETINKATILNTKTEELTKEYEKAKIELTDKVNEVKETVNTLTSTIGQPSGITPLDEAGKVSSQFLPSYVDDVLEFDTFDSFPEVGESGKIYVTLDTNLEYRWSGSKYTQISKSLAIGEIEGTAFEGNKGKILEGQVQEIINSEQFIKVRIGNDIVEVDPANDFAVLLSDGTLFLEKDKDWEGNMWWNAYNANYKELYDEEYPQKFSRVAKVISVGKNAPIFAPYGQNLLREWPEHNTSQKASGGDWMMRCNFNSLPELNLNDLSGAVWGFAYQSKIPNGSIFRFPDAVTGLFQSFEGCWFERFATANFTAIEPIGDSNVLISGKNISVLQATFSNCYIPNQYHIILDTPNVINLASAFIGCHFGACWLNFWKFPKAYNLANTFKYAHFSGKPTVDLDTGARYVLIDLGLDNDIAKQNSTDTFRGVTSVHDELRIDNFFYNIDSGCFADIKGIKKLTITSNVSSIKNKAFANSDFETIEIAGQGITNIGDNIFGGINTTLKNLKVPPCNFTTSSYCFSDLLALSKDSIKGIIDNIVRAGVWFDANLLYLVEDEWFEGWEKITEEHPAFGSFIIDGGKGWTKDNGDALVMFTTTEEKTKIFKQLHPSNAEVDVKIQEAITNIELPEIDTSNLITKDKINVANGVAGLDENGKVNSNNLPIAGNTSNSRGAVYSTGTKSNQLTIRQSNCVVIDNEGKITLQYENTKNSFSHGTTVKYGQYAIQAQVASNGQTLSIGGVVYIYDHTVIPDDNYTATNLVTAGELNYRLANFPIATGGVSGNNGLMSATDKYNLDNLVRGNSNDDLTRFGTIFLNELSDNGITMLCLGENSHIEVKNKEIRFPIKIASFTRDNGLLNTDIGDYIIQGYIPDARNYDTDYGLMSKIDANYLDSLIYTAGNIMDNTVIIQPDDNIKGGAIRFSRYKEVEKEEEGETWTETEFDDNPFDYDNSGNLRLNYFAYLPDTSGDSGYKTLVSPLSLTFPKATTTTDGMMSAADKQKLDNLSTTGGDTSVANIPESVKVLLNTISSTEDNPYTIASWLNSILIENTGFVDLLMRMKSNGWYSEGLISTRYDNILALEGEVLGFDTPTITPLTDTITLSVDVIKNASDAVVNPSINKVKLEYTIPASTTTKAGAMTASDKVSLDLWDTFNTGNKVWKTRGITPVIPIDTDKVEVLEIPSGLVIQTKVNGVTPLFDGNNNITRWMNIEGSNGFAAEIPLATEESTGLLSAKDKTILDKLASRTHPVCVDLGNISIGEITAGISKEYTDAEVVENLMKSTWLLFNLVTEDGNIECAAQSYKIASIKRFYKTCDLVVSTINGTFYIDMQVSVLDGVATVKIAKSE